MCEPVSITLGTLAVAGGVMKGLADKSAADASADAQRRNATVSEEAASQALQRGETEAGKIHMQGSSLQGTQRAAYGATGVDVNSGSAAQTQEDTAFMTDVDAMTARNNAQTEAWGLVKQADNQRRSAANTESAGSNAFAADIIGGAASAVPYVAGAFKTPPPPGKPS